ncbi:T9SS type A sorting domain-containing protein [Bacteroidota bacterium]
MKKQNKILITIFILLLTFTGIYYFFNIGLKEEKPIKTSGALDALNFWTEQRAYPNMVIPDIGYYDAYIYSRQNLRNNTDNFDTTEWQQIGPHNVGGRTNSIAINPFNPNTIYAGSASGGLWRSYTGGVGTSAWEYVVTGYPVLGVGSIAISPVDTNTIYIGTGEVYGYQNAIGGLTIRETRGSYGIGILKTTNCGISWTKSLDWSYNQRRGVQVVRINPLNPNTIWAGTTEGTYRSYDAGTSWTQVHNTIMVTDLIIDPSDTSRILIACGNLNSAGNGLYRTTNSGNNWVKLTNGLPVSYGGKALFSVYLTSPNVIFASIGMGSSTGAGTRLVKTVNSGETWTTVSNQDYADAQGWFSHFVGVNPVDSSKIIAAGIDIWKSTTGGSNLVKKSDWTLWFSGRIPIGGPEGPPAYSHCDHHAIAYHPTNPDIVYFGNDGGVFRTTDGGETFEGLNGGYQTSQFYNGFSSGNIDSSLSFGGMQDNGVAIYDGDLAWIKKVFWGDGCWTAINSLNNDIMYGSYQYLNIRKSTNSGNTWTTITIPPGGTTGFVAPYILGVNNPNIIYAGRSRVYKSTNGGSSWTTTNNGNNLDGNPVLTFGISSIDANKVFASTAPVGSRSKIFRTTNGGDNWDDVTSILPDRYPIDIAVDPENDTYVYIVFSGFGSSHIYKSSNSGDNWVDIGQSLPDVPTSSVIVDPQSSKIIYLGNDLGIYVTTNSGASWLEFQNGMVDAAIIMDLSISPGNRKLRAATHGKGVFEKDLLDPTVGVSSNTNFIEGYNLGQNYPNPFNPVTKINFDIPKSGFVTLKIYDMLGKEVQTLVSSDLTTGSYSVDFDASRLTSGVYFYKLKTNDYSDVKKMVLIK